MDYITAKEAAEKWNITVRRVQALCIQGRIDGATRLGNMWVIPTAAGKPVDARTRDANINQNIDLSNEQEGMV